MIKLFASVCIAAPAAAVWSRLAKLEDIQLWSESVFPARCTGALSQGVGAEVSVNWRAILLLPSDEWRGMKDDSSSVRVQEYRYTERQQQP